MAHRPRYFYGDFALWREGIDHEETDRRGALQVHQGADRDFALVVPASPNMTAQVEVRTLGAPHASSKDQKGWRSIAQALRVQLRGRASRGDPLVWVEDDTRMKTVGSFASPTVTSAAHGFSNGDVVLIRRLGVGIYALGTVGSVAANTFVLTLIAGSLSGIAASDEIHLVEAYWYPMVFRELRATRADGGDWYAPEVTYSFEGSASSTYSRTSAGVGS